ncbi:transposase [Paraburkholderia sp. CNPSo 3274]|uniref:transposase n=2 Tax=Paraburkholderia sp. CNPSo 3274 TaxID=2940932 RepID=UPI0035CD3489
MKRFIEGEDRKQVTLLPECLDDFVAEDTPVRIIEAFVEELDLESLSFDGAMPSTTGRPSYHPAVLLKIYIYGYLNRVQSSRRLERECVFRRSRTRISVEVERFRGIPESVFGAPKRVFIFPKSVFSPPKRLFTPPKCVFGEPKRKARFWLAVLRMAQSAGG